ncbi:MAG: phosphopantetheine-binding protein [Pirellulaceae bacterium]
MRPSETQSARGVGRAAARHTASELSAFLVDFVVEQTGYPPEIVELDADLEADLGIDSIKKAQLFGELREMFAIDPAQLVAGKPGGAGEGSRGGMDRVRTLRQILDALLTQQSVPKEVTSVAPVSEQAPGGPQSPSESHLPSATDISAPYAPTDGTVAPLPEKSARELGGNSPSSNSAQRSTLAGSFHFGIAAIVQSAHREALLPVCEPTCVQWWRVAMLSRWRLNRATEVGANVRPAFSNCPKCPQPIHRAYKRLDRALVGQTRWQPIRQRSAQSNVVWLADWLTPSWLSSQGSTLGLKVNQSRQIELDALWQRQPFGRVDRYAIVRGRTVRLASQRR